MFNYQVITVAPCLFAICLRLHYAYIPIYPYHLIITIDIYATAWSCSTFSDRVSSVELLPFIHSLRLAGIYKQC